MKKILAFLLTLAMSVTVVTSLTACKKKAEDDFDGTIITFYHTMSATNLQPVLNRYIEEFNKIYPGIKVKASQEGNYDDVRKKVSSELQVGEGPNIAYCYPDHVALYNRSKKVVVLDDYINSNDVVPAGKFGNAEDMPIRLTQEQQDDFIAGYYNEGKQFGDGKMYTLPFSKSTEVLYYNENAFIAAGLKKEVDGVDVAVVPTTWWCNQAGHRGNPQDDCAECKTTMEYTCKKLKEYDANCIPLGYDSDANWFITMCEQLNIPYTSSEAKKAHYLFNTQAHKDFVTTLNTWYNNKWVTTQGINGKYTSGLFVEKPEAAPNTANVTKSYMSIGSSAGASHQCPKATDGKLAFNVGIASIPQADPTNGKVISQGPSVCILGNATDDEILASWLFIKYLTTNVAFQADFSIASGYVPVIKSVTSDETYAKHIARKGVDTKNGVISNSAQVCLTQEDFYFTSPAFAGSSKAREEVDALLTKCLVFENKDATALKTNIDKAFADAIANCEYYFNDAK